MDPNPSRRTPEQIAEATGIAVDHVRELGSERGRDGFDGIEATNAVHWELANGAALRRSTHVGADFVAEDGTTIDAMGPVPPGRFRERPFALSLKHHLRKSVDRLSIDISTLASEDRARVLLMLERLAREERARIDIVGGF